MRRYAPMIVANVGIYLLQTKYLICILGFFPIPRSAKSSNYFDRKVCFLSFSVEKSTVSCVIATDICRFLLQAYRS